MEWLILRGFFKDYKPSCIEQIIAFLFIVIVFVVLYLVG